jgi:hypothetical protein
MIGDCPRRAGRGRSHDGEEGARECAAATAAGPSTPRPTPPAPSARPTASAADGDYAERGRSIG